MARVSTSLGASTPVVSTSNSNRSGCSQNSTISDSAPPAAAASSPARRTASAVMAERPARKGES